MGLSIFYREHTEAPGIVGTFVALKKRFAVKLRDLGPGFVALRIIHRITPDILFSATDIIVVASDIPAAAASDTPDPELRWANEAEMDIIAASIPRGKTLRENYGANSMVAAIMDEDKVTALEWFVTPPDDGGSSWLLPPLEGSGLIRFRLPRNDNWSIWSWVDPDHRGQRLMVRCRAFANIRLAKENYARSWGAVYSGNERAIRAHAKRAYRPLGRVSYVRVLGLTFVREDGVLKIGRWNKNRPYEIDLGALIAQESSGAGHDARAIA